MANSSIIQTVKNQFVRELIRDKAIVDAIDSPDVASAEKLINSHIFTFGQNPFTINKAITFITIQVHIPHVSDKNGVFISPEVEIWIISHERHMLVDNIPKITANRNDYLSMLIDQKFNGRDDFGLGKLRLQINIEGSFQTDYLYRKMVFKGMDINNSLCEED